MYPSCPYSRLESLKQNLGLFQQTAIQQVTLSCHIQPSRNSALQMSLPSDTPQGVANALEYLQHHLHKLTERQNISKNNINTTLAVLTICQGYAEREQSDPEQSGVTLEWKGFDNKMGTTLVSARALCLNLLLRIWLRISGGQNCCQEFQRGIVQINRSEDRTRRRHK